MEKLFTAFDRVVVFDTETTGLEFRSDRIIELGAVAFERGGETASCEHLIRLPEPLCVPPFVEQLTGITNEMLNTEGVGESVAAQSFCELFDGAERPLLVAYNAQFDLNFLYHFLLRCESVDLLRRVRFLDALTVYRDRRDYPHKLANAIEAFGIENAVNSHRAVDDARAAALLLGAMEREKDDLLNYVNLFGYHPKYGVAGRRVSSVTYRAQPFERSMPLYERED